MESLNNRRLLLIFLIMEDIKLHLENIRIVIVETVFSENKKIVQTVCQSNLFL